MSEKTINTRLKLKYDTHENWSTNNPVLLKGEVAVASISVQQAGTVNHVPSVLIKIGDGTSTYNELGFVYARAADVADWAKANTKPTYSASEINGLADYIAGEIEDTNTTYQLVKVDDYNYKLQSKEKGATAWTDVVGGTITIPKYDDTDVKADIDAVSDKVTTLIGSDANKSVRTIANEELAKQLIPDNASESLDTLQEIASWIQQHPEDAATMNSKIATLEGTSHTHANATVLDGITSAKVTSWDATVTKVGTLEEKALLSDDILILDCGDSNI